ncbi:hypothetical protein JOL79_21935 [Microbispora sp. RL4-1S]|uniref:Pectate lyase n=1 Tax=Microbispora oryzae TaxID=2806554 RepID=A0A940WIQ9_9ACTN|nr:hypothetical protein [Microbispora oryzae]MBP2706474.1 hypothetical protein [Microbispora oryzae]
MVLRIWRPAFAVLAILAFGSLQQGQASADAKGSHGGSWTVRNHGTVTVTAGNGSNNQNEPRVFSPTNNQGVQIVSANSRNTANMTGFCRKSARVCKINENLWFPVH